MRNCKALAKRSIKNPLSFFDINFQAHGFDTYVVDRFF